MVYEIICDGVFSGVKSIGKFYKKKGDAEVECEKLNENTSYAVYKVVENDSISTLGLIQNKDGSWEIDSSLL